MSGIGGGGAKASGLVDAETESPRDSDGGAAKSLDGGVHDE